MHKNLNISANLKPKKKNTFDGYSGAEMGSFEQTGLK
jgi:hypothetical protein